jgi:hypothetical protein
MKLLMKKLSLKLKKEDVIFYICYMYIIKLVNKMSIEWVFCISEKNNNNMLKENKNIMNLRIYCKFI